MMSIYIYSRSRRAQSESTLVWGVSRLTFFLGDKTRVNLKATMRLQAKATDPGGHCRGLTQALWSNIECSAYAACIVIYCGHCGAADTYFFSLRMMTIFKSNGSSTMFLCAVIEMIILTQEDTRRRDLREASAPDIQPLLKGWSPEELDNFTHPIDALILRAFRCCIW